MPSLASFTPTRLARKIRREIKPFQNCLEETTSEKTFQKQRRVYGRDVEEVFPGISKTRSVIQNAAPTPAVIGNVLPYELVLISSICAWLNPQKIFEFGTYDGLTTLHLAMNSPHSAQIFTLDLHPNDPIRQQDTKDTDYTRGVAVGSHFLNAPEADRIKQIFGNSTEFDESPYHHSVQLIFVDAGHAYSLVKSDSEKALKMVAPGGVILWHDFSRYHTGVYTCLNELSTQVPLFLLPGTSIVCYTGGR